MNKTKKLSVVAILSALAIVFALIEIPYFIPWLKFDLSELVVLIAVDTVGLLGAIAISFVKTIIQLVTGDTSPYNIGEITALVGSLTFAITFAITKKLHIIARLLIVMAVFTTVMTAFNYYIATPVYFTQTFDYNNLIAVGSDYGIVDQSTYLKFIITTFVPFNLLKSGIISVIYLLVYKRIINLYNDKFSK